MRASRARTPSAETSSGLISTSLMRCCSTIIWRKRQRAVAINFDKLPAGTEEDHWPELRVDGAAENQLVAFAPHHRLHRDAVEGGRAGLRFERRLNVAKRLPHRSGVFEIQHHAAYVAFVRDRLRMKFQDHGKADCRRRLRRFIGGARDARFNGWDSVKRENFFRFDFGE